MSASYEQIFLAIALKSNLITKERAVEALGALKAAQDQGLATTVEEIVLGKGFMAEDQVRMCRDSAKRFQEGQQGQPQAQKPQSNEVIPGYQIVGKLGVGGTATVFLARDRENRQVALKILHPVKAKDEKQLERFNREARLLCEFEHPNLVKGYRHGVHNALNWFAMEYIDGVSVQDLVDKDTRISESRALEIILEAARALEYIESKGYVHKDIKPANIMITRDRRVKLCDLGFAEALWSIPGENEEEEYTVGTVEFMSPEQAQGKRDLDIRSDIYALGATLYYMVLGKLPFEGTNDLEVMAKHVLEELNSAEIKNRRISRHMHYFIERMMSKDKELRYPSPSELVRDITEQIEGFKALQFEDAAQQEKETVILRGLKGDSEDGKTRTTRKVPNPTTRIVKPNDQTTKKLNVDTSKYSRLGQITGRFKKPNKPDRDENAK